MRLLLIVFSILLILFAFRVYRQICFDKFRLATRRELMDRYDEIYYGSDWKTVDSKYIQQVKNDYHSF